MWMLFWHTSYLGDSLEATRGAVHKYTKTVHPASEGCVTDMYDAILQMGANKTSRKKDLSYISVR